MVIQFKGKISILFKNDCCPKGVPMTRERQSGAPPEKLGSVTVPSGVVMIVDTGLLWMWCHDKPPLLPEGRVGPEIVQSANESIDYRITGPNAIEVSRVWAGANHPLFLYDRPPPPKVAPLKEKFDDYCRQYGQQASLDPLLERVTHRRRIDLLLEFSPTGGEIFFGGAWGAVIAGLPTDRELAVVGERMPPGPYSDRWRSVALVCCSGGKVARTEEVATVAVDEARLGIFDVDAIGAWQHDAPLDGCADFVFWGRDAKELAREMEAQELDEENFGWLDLPVQEAVERGMGVEDIRAERGLKFATDFRPHSHHHQVMEQVRATSTESGTIEVGGAETCTFMTSWGDGLYPVYRELDAEGHLVSVRIDLGSDETVQRMRTLESKGS
jgi:hypothetical protein